MSANVIELPDYLMEGCASLGLDAPDKLRSILHHINDLPPVSEAPAELIPGPLDGIREWVANTINGHKIGMARVSIAVWFAWKLRLWATTYATLDRYYVDGCGWSPAQGDRLRHHGEVLVALALAGIDQMPVEKQARAVRNIITSDQMGDFFRRFYASHDPSAYHSASATKRAAQRYAEIQLLVARSRLAAGSGGINSSIAETTEGDTEKLLLASLPPEQPEENNSSTLAELLKRLEIVAPDTSIEEFTAHCVESEFRRIHKELDSPPEKMTPLLDGLAQHSSRHKEALDRLCRPKLEAFLLHLAERESRNLLKRAVQAEWNDQQSASQKEEPVHTAEAQPPGKKQKKKKPIDAKLPRSCHSGHPTKTTR